MGASRNITVEKEHKNYLNKYLTRSYCSKTARRDFQDALCVNTVPFLFSAEAIWGPGGVVMVVVVDQVCRLKRFPQALLTNNIDAEGFPWGGKLYLS
jgi:hypothetical protein